MLEEKKFTIEDLERIRKIAMEKSIKPVDGFYYFWGGRILNTKEANKYLRLLRLRKFKKAEKFLKTLKKELKVVL